MLLLQLLWDGINVPFLSTAPTYLKQPLLQTGFYPWPVKFLELSDKGQFQPQSQQVQNSAQMLQKNVGQLRYTQQCEDKGFTETSLQRRIKVEHSFII